MKARGDHVVVHVGSAVLTLGAMIATPLSARGGPVRRRLTSVVVAGLAATTAAGALRRWPARRVGAAFAAVTTGSLAVEHAGVTRGFPFGRYRYTGALRPQVAGVPAIVPLAWFAMALPAREAAHALLGRRSTRRTRVLVGSLALAAWDLFLDPQMTAEGYWVWSERGRYRGIPMTNFVGWVAVGAAVMGVLEMALPPIEDRAEPTLVAQYGAMAAFETLGFAAFFKDRLVALVGGAAMLPIAAGAARGTIRSARR